MVSSLRFAQTVIREARPWPSSPTGPRPEYPLLGLIPFHCAAARVLFCVCVSAWAFAPSGTDVLIKVLRAWHS